MLRIFVDRFDRWPKWILHLLKWLLHNGFKLRAADGRKIGLKNSLFENLDRAKSFENVAFSYIFYFWKFERLYK